MLLETKGWEVYTSTEYPGFGQNTDTSDPVQLHLHIWIAVGIAEVGQVRPPRSVLGISFHDDSILIQGIRKCQCSLRFLPGVQVVRLLSAKPIWKRAPDIYRPSQLVWIQTLKQQSPLTRDCNILVVPH